MATNSNWLIVEAIFNLILWVIQNVLRNHSPGLYSNSIKSSYIKRIYKVFLSSWYIRYGVIQKQTIQHMVGTPFFKVLEHYRSIDAVKPALRLTVANWEVVLIVYVTSLCWIKLFVSFDGVLSWRLCLLSSNFLRLLRLSFLRTYRSQSDYHLCSDHGLYCALYLSSCVRSFSNVCTMSSETLCSLVF